MFSISRKLVRSDSGFSLIECMVAILVFALAALMYTTTAPVAAREAYLGGQYAEAIGIAQGEIDQMREIGYGRLNYAQMNGVIIDAAPTKSPFSFTGKGNIANALPGGTGTVAISTVTPPVTGTSAIQAVVTVTWTPNPDSKRTSSISLAVQIMQCE